ncbi:MAG: hypothetical protein MRY21_08445 [Simkaniaceae bacterium]|nr:hypothetical protein [Simkaniaceae bacterium]
MDARVLDRSGLSTIVGQVDCARSNNSYDSSCIERSGKKKRLKREDGCHLDLKRFIAKCLPRFKASTPLYCANVSLDNGNELSSADLNRVMDSISKIDCYENQVRRDVKAVRDWRLFQTTTEETKVLLDGRKDIIRRVEEIQVINGKGDIEAFSDAILAEGLLGMELSCPLVGKILDDMVLGVRKDLAESGATQVHTMQILKLVIRQVHKLGIDVLQPQVVTFLSKRDLEVVLERGHDYQLPGPLYAKFLEFVSRRTDETSTTISNDVAT